MLISDEMVEAAARAINPYAWNNPGHYMSRQVSIMNARAALEASIPAKDVENVVAYNEAKQLAIYLHSQHYAESAPNWQPLSDIRGVISQIDNMVVGLVRKQEE
ncbi:MAG: hypothetical protein JSR13_05905 [Proteobacteria bacterium]|nr:hypothetical protein [Pseudomonadota bacterium]